jgi:hypothetical protein
MLNCQVAGVERVSRTWLILKDQADPSFVQVVLSSLIFELNTHRWFDPPIRAIFCLVDLRYSVGNRRHTCSQK